MNAPTTTPVAPTFAAILFDGTNAAAHQVEVTVLPATITIRDPFWDQSTQIPLAAVRIDPSVSGTPYRIDLPNGGQLQIGYSKELATALDTHLPKAITLLGVLERRGSWLLGGTGLAVVFVGLLYFFGLPMLAESIAPLISFEQQKRISQAFLKSADIGLFEPSKVDAAGESRTRQLLVDLHPEKVLPYPQQLLMRHWASGPNALAIFPDTIIVIDEIVTLLEPDELRAVLAHEIGHLHYNHGMKGMIRGSALTILGTIIFGGEPTIAASLASSAMLSRYSQEQETAADLFAVDLLRSNNYDPRALGRALKKLADGEDAHLTSFFSSHPLTNNRVVAIDAAAQATTPAALQHRIEPIR